MGKIFVMTGETEPVRNWTGPVCRFRGFARAPTEHGGAPYFKVCFGQGAIPFMDLGVAENNVEWCNAWSNQGFGGGLSEENNANDGYRIEPWPFILPSQSRDYGSTIESGAGRFWHSGFDHGINPKWDTFAVMTGAYTSGVLIAEVFQFSKATNENPFDYVTLTTSDVQLFNSAGQQISWPTIGVTDPYGNVNTYRYLPPSCIARGTIPEAYRGTYID